MQSTDVFKESLKCSDSWPEFPAKVPFQLQVISQIESRPLIMPQSRKMRKKSTRSQTLFPSQKPWILRNLTAKKYVRLSAVTSPGRLSSRYAPFISGLGEVLLYMTNWTDDSSGVLGESLHGEWAGHRFDVTVIDASLDDWEDVSDKFRFIAELDQT